MATIIEQNYQSGNIVFDVNYATGSIRDRSPYTAAATVTAPVQWANTKKGYGILNNTTGVLSYDDNSSNRLAGSDATFIILGNFDKQVATARFVSKRDGVKIDYEIYTNSTTQITFYDWTNLSVMTGPIIGKSLIIITLNSGQKPKLYLDGTYITEGSLTNTIPNNVTPPKLYISNFYTGIFPNKNVLNRITILNRVLSAEEIAQLHTELVHQKYPLRAYSFGKRLSPIEDPPGCPSLLKTDFTTKLRDGRLADLSGNGWHGTIKPGFVASPTGIFGNSLVADSTTRSYVDFGDVTPINGASKLTMVWSGKRGSSNAVESIYSKATATNARIGAYFTTTNILTSLGNGEYFLVADTNVNTTLFRADVYDGTALVANRGQIYLDNNKSTMSVSAGCPTTFPNNTGISLEIGRLGYSTNNQPCKQFDFFAIYPYALTESQVSFIYKQIARRQTFELDMQKVPVTLANLVGPIDVPNTPFRLQSGGTWKISEDSSGKRWFESVSGNSTSVYMPSKQAYGTWVFDVYHTTASEYIYFISNKISISDSDRNAYGISIGSTAISFVKYSPSSGNTVLMSSSNYVAVGNKYTIAISRNSTGEFTIYSKSISSGKFEKIIATSGSNPVTENVYTTSSYLLFATFTAANAGKFSNPRMFQGVLTADDLNQMGL